MPRVGVGVHAIICVSESRYAFQRICLLFSCAMHRKNSDRIVRMRGKGMHLFGGHFNWSRSIAVLFTFFLRFPSN